MLQRVFLHELEHSDYHVHCLVVSVFPRYLVLLQWQLRLIHSFQVASSFFWDYPCHAELFGLTQTRSSDTCSQAIIEWVCAFAIGNYVRHHGRRRLSCQRILSPLDFWFILDVHSDELLLLVDRHDAIWVVDRGLKTRLAGQRLRPFRILGKWPDIFLIWLVYNVRLSLTLLPPLVPGRINWNLCHMQRYVFLKLVWLHWLLRSGQPNRKVIRFRAFLPQRQLL